MFLSGGHTHGNKWMYNVKVNPYKVKIAIFIINLLQEIFYNITTPRYAS